MKINNIITNESQLDEVSANPDYLRAAERSISQAQATQRTFGKSPEEKAAARRTEINRDKGIAGYTKRHKAAHPEMYPQVKAQPAPKLRDPSTEYSDDYSTWARGRRDTMEQGVAEGQTPEQEIERLKLRQNAEHGGASLKRQSATQARIRELEKQIKDKKGVAEAQPEKIADRYDPEDFDDMVLRLKQKAKEQERKHGPVDLAKLAQRLRDIGDKK